MSKSLNFNTFVTFKKWAWSKLTFTHILYIEIIVEPWQSVVYVRYGDNNQGYGPLARCTVVLSLYLYKQISAHNIIWLNQLGIKVDPGNGCLLALVVPSCESLVQTKFFSLAETFLSTELIKHKQLHRITYPECEATLCIIVQLSINTNRTSFGVNVKPLWIVSTRNGIRNASTCFINTVQISGRNVQYDDAYTLQQKTFCKLYAIKSATVSIKKSV